MDLVLLAVAAVWGGVTGLLIPRAAYRFAVEPEEPWRTACPAGHAFTGPLGGWLGPARCAACGSRAQTAVPPSGEKAEAPVPPYADERTAPVSPSGDGAEAPALPYGDDRPAPAPYAPGTLAPLVTVLACTVLAAATGARPELAGWLLLAPVAVLLATVDRRVHRLPDPLTLPLAAAAVLLLGGAALLPGHAGSWTSALLGGLALGGFYFLLFLINPNGMGFGDVKLALALGVALGWYGWEVLFLGGFAGFLFGAAYGLGLVLLRRAGRRTGIPFGPFMIAGALTGILLGALAA
ncbi:prepilin peptidase [Streptomyces microflavus]|uniref:Prepilin peptidase n=1 Tax=Streptomyces microflavus TaxID=1919 RepID=A0A7J0CW71_STRMI|nr:MULTISPECIES: A24 family peptidase [Streptomyces]MDX2975534.1 A24 family peptidase [Streptomyces sp. NRRL_B-2249]WSS34325.1 A24 family peptidase [Streptomyces microflavus]WST17109.1 A24 family peptidase [Streptomyces microflavus]GFN06776.1 prepilin peptidase [Streptomyces microflavus]GGX80952.1 prepilin peptidase [Streptomyces microflavus]